MCDNSGLSAAPLGQRFPYMSISDWTEVVVTLKKVVWTSGDRFLLCWLS